MPKKYLKVHVELSNVLKLIQAYLKIKFKTPNAVPTIARIRKKNSLF